MTQTKPTITPTMARPGKLTSICPVAGSVVAGDVFIQPTTALASSSTKSTAVAVIEPRTVIIPGRHGVTGPSETGVRGRCCRADPTRRPRGSARSAQPSRLAGLLEAACR